MMTREVSAEGRALIQQFEGLSLMAYLCPAGKWTIGYGHTDGVQPGDKITAAHADSLLAADLVSYGNAVADALGACEATWHEFDAMVSLAFNVGIAGFKGSTVLRLHRQGDRQGAARAFGMWNKAMVNGRLQEMAGLTRRRAAETAFYLTEDAPPVKAMPQAVALPPTAATSKTVIAGGVTVAAGAASVADQVTPVLNSIATTGASLKSVMQLGGAALSIIALAAGAYMLWRYIQKRRRGEVLST
ncbi:MAG: lysozyme [Rhodospirillales bacterium]|nr:lysozyme [Rhodospirillales bacterium]